MKNIYYRLILTILLCLSFFSKACVLAYDNNAKIQDELLQSDYLKRFEGTSIKKETLPITDELLNPDLYKISQFRLSVYTNKYADKPIEDELLKDSFFKENIISSLTSDKTIPDEYFIEKNIDLKKVRKITSKNKYDFAKKIIPIQIKIAENLKSTQKVAEGSTIPFVAQHDFEINGKKYSSGTTIWGRVETISDSDKMGTPESIKISNFYIQDEKEINLFGTISKTGANRSLWVYPLYQAGNICFYVAGFIFVPIHGGRAKLLLSESYTVFYETQ